MLMKVLKWLVMPIETTKKNTQKTDKPAALPRKTTAKPLKLVTVYGASVVQDDKNEQAAFMTRNTLKK